MISILHISDLHITKSARWGHMKDCILKEAQRVKSRPQGEKLLVITGDFHNFGESNYDEAERFFRELIAEMDIDVERDVFLIPGNHDVGNKSTMNAIFPTDPDWSERQELIVDKLANEKTKPEGSEYEAFVRDRLEAYIPYKNFVTRLGIYKKDEEPAAVHVRCWRGKLNLFHLNTTLVADGKRKKDQRVDRLSVADDSIWEGFSAGLPALALGHNHFFDLHDEDKDDIRAAFNRHGVCAYLCGDTHKENIKIDEQDIKLEKGHNLATVPTIPIVVGVKGAANDSDSYSDFGLYWHDWDEDAKKVTLRLLRWKPDVSRTCFDESRPDEYYMPRKDCISHSKNFILSSVLRIYQEDNYSFCYKPDQLKLVGVERKKILKDIVDWANTDNEIGMFAILGASGCGKSRLAFEVWRELEQQGWNALWIDRLLTDELVIQENLKQFSGNVLIVVDDVQFCTLIFATVLRYFLSSNSVERRGISKVRFVITAYEECEEIKFYSRFLGQEGNYCSYELKMLENSEIGELIGNYINTRNDLPNLNIAATKESIIKKLEDDTIGESAPLYALFMAEAICSSKNIENWAQKDILDYVISIENSKIEKALEDMQLSAYQKPLYRNAVRTIRMIATLTGGVQYDLLATISQLSVLRILGDFNHETLLKELLARANLIESEHSVVRSMKPDIVGEYFCLDVLLDRILLDNNQSFNQAMRFILQNGKALAIHYINAIVKNYKYISHEKEDMRFDALEKLSDEHFAFYGKIAYKNGKSVLRKSEHQWTPQPPSSTQEERFLEKMGYREKDFGYSYKMILPEGNQDMEKYYNEGAEATAKYYAEIDALCDCETITSGHARIIDPGVISYTGQTLWRTPHGRGVVTWNDGTTYEGSVYYHAFYGLGTFKHPDGREYSCNLSCSFRENVLSSGWNKKDLTLGTFIWKDGARYEGGWHCGVRHGYGIMKYPDGTVVAGVWKYDEYIGHTLGDCSVYVGAAYEGEGIESESGIIPNGKGKIIYNDGTEILGKWKQGKFISPNPMSAHINDAKYQVPANRGPYNNTLNRGSILDNYA